MRLPVRVLRHVRRQLGDRISIGIRISQGKVNDLTHKWPEGIAVARTMFGGIAQSGADFIHLTEHRAWEPAFGESGPSLVALARQYAPETTLIANGNLSDPERAVQVLDDGADLVAVGRGALANPDWPHKVRKGQSLDEFDGSVLSPIANIEGSELAFAD